MNRTLPIDTPEEMLAAWLDHLGRNQRPEDADGCWPLPCTCGLIDLITRTRATLFASTQVVRL